MVKDHWHNGLIGGSVNDLYRLREFAKLGLEKICNVSLLVGLNCCLTTTK